MYEPNEQLPTLPLLTYWSDELLREFISAYIYKTYYVAFHQKVSNSTGIIPIFIDLAQVAESRTLLDFISSKQCNLIPCNC